MSTNRKQLEKEIDKAKKEILELKQVLAQKQAEVFEAERLALKSTEPAQPLKLNAAEETEGIALESSKRKLERDLWLLEMVTGVSVAAYERDQYCSIMFHMQHDTPAPLHHGLRIDLSSETKQVTKHSLPNGFNLDAVTAEYDSIMYLECLGAVQRSLMAYYDRQKQYESLTKLVRYDLKTFRAPDTTHVELRLMMVRRKRPDEVVDASLDLDYRVYDVRAKRVSLYADIQEEDMDALNKQCSVFRKKPMDEAFQKCFMQGRGPWECYISKDDMEDGTVPKSLHQIKKPRKKKVAAPGSDDETYLPDDIVPKK